MDEDIESTLTFSPGTVVWLCCCAGFGANLGWYALDAVAHTLGLVARWWR